MPENKWQLRAGARTTDGRKIAVLSYISPEMADEITKPANKAEWIDDWIASALVRSMRKHAEENRTSLAKWSDLVMAELMEVTNTVTQRDLDDDPESFEGMRVGDTWTDDIVISSMQLPIPKIVLAPPQDMV